MKTAAVAAVWLAAFLGVVLVAPDEQPATASARRVHGAVAGELVQGKPAQWWARRAVQARKDANARGRRIRELKRVLARDVTIADAIDLAATAYAVDAATLKRKASCESTGGHGYNPNAANLHSSARGLFQFLTTGRARRYGDHAVVDGGTWATTPFWRFSPYDPFAAALAAAWMHAHHRGSEWVCR